MEEKCHRTASPHDDKPDFISGERGLMFSAVKPISA